MEDIGPGEAYEKGVWEGTGREKKMEILLERKEEKESLLVSLR